jgi:hypothetical protein
MYDVLFPNQGQLEPDDLARYAVQWVSTCRGSGGGRPATVARIRRDVASGIERGGRHAQPVHRWSALRGTARRGGLAQALGVSTD